VTPSEQINCGKIGFRCAARPKIENKNDDENEHEHDFSISEFGLKRSDSGPTSQGASTELAEVLRRG
jgi:hypothetical protein